MNDNIEFYKRRLAEHKRCYDLAVNANDEKEMKSNALEMRNINQIIKSIESKS